MRKQVNKDPFKPRPAFQPIDPKLRGDYVIRDKATGNIYRAVGPSLTAILSEMNKTLNDVDVTMLKGRGKDFVFFIPYVAPPTATPWDDSPDVTGG